MKIKFFSTLLSVIILTTFASGCSKIQANVQESVDAAVEKGEEIGKKIEETKDKIEQTADNIKTVRDDVQKTLNDLQ